jgi:DNA gyrase subunit A
MSNERIVPILLEDEMKTAYIDYAMSVIVSRALPDVRDGLKPVHRRVLYGMYELGVGYNKAHKKSARIVGEVLGKFHPHGDTSVYDAMVRLAQDWSMRYPLVDGQGNFGSMDGDSPAAMRYTEARLRRITDQMMDDLNRDTVDFQPNFDDTLMEPTVMPTEVPNLLVNGATGIAVGMATNMLPHNLTESINAILAQIENPDITLEGLMEHIHGPDLPTGGIIYGVEGIKDAFATGRGKVVVRGRAEIQQVNGRDAIIISEIPYQVNKAMLVMKIADLVNDKKIDGIAGDGLRDESDRNGVRIVIECRRDANANVILNQLYKLSPLQTSYGINNVCLVRGRPMTLNLSQIITEFIAFRIECIVRRTRFDLRKAEERSHILEGFLIALDHIDEIIKLIRASRTPDEAQAGLMSNFALSELQSKAILEMRLQRLTGMERDKIKNEYDEIQKHIAELKAILGSDDLQKEVVKAELVSILERYGDKRRTEITHSEGEINMEDIISDDEMLVTITHLGYIKRTRLDEYRSQGRGGRGSSGARTKNEDFIEQMFITTAHNYLLFFTEKGRCYWMRTYELPEASKNAQGRFIQNLLSLPNDDKIKACIPIKNLTDVEFCANHYIIFCTKMGVIKKTPVEQYSRPRQGGINAISINDGDELLEVKLTNGSNEIVIATRQGLAIRFNESKVRSMGRTATGVRGVMMDEKDTDNRVVGMVCVDPADTTVSLMMVSELGMGKRSALEDYRVTNRGGKGVTTMKLTEKTGKLVAIKTVRDGDDLVITTKSGITIRMTINDLRIMGRATQGVKVIRLDEDESIADVAVVHDAAEEATDPAALLEGIEMLEGAEAVAGAQVAAIESDDDTDNTDIVEDTADDVDDDDDDNDAADDDDQDVADDEEEA